MAKWQTHYLEVVAPQGMQVRLLSRAPGRLAQLVEHFIYTEGVTGSSPVAPTLRPASLAQCRPKILRARRSVLSVVEGLSINLICRDSSGS